MTNLDDTPARVRLDRALDDLAVTFHGMAARPDETQCVCHWGSPDELALLKVPDRELDPDLLRRTWSAPDWNDHGAVLRRVLPQFGRALVGGAEPAYATGEIGQSFARSDWLRWPPRQRESVREFLHAWWSHSLTDPAPPIPVHALLTLCTEASATLTPWLAAWEALDHPTADQYLAEAAALWVRDLLYDDFPWPTWHDEDALRAELITWLARHTPARIPAHDADRIRLASLPTPARWEDPHW
ncbi:hypothetical protein EV284_5626 [Streptomyces sp. BK022]|uniref:hypothetical protein n=1 Tax=Streptomyces sp. BK022 TaxID=2512123 RepID=UPI00102A8FA9|nr:hypothetical protein [Streptomyces sp. BK022]RZU29410.1 hypothetical protein EV284_5626 [Streptomyces sp. BK022]